MQRMELGFAGTGLRRTLVAAVLRGEKTATAGLLEDYERDGEALPVVGEQQLLVDEHDQPVAVIEITEATVVPLGEVDLAFARDEGEGFATVSEWRAAHARFWSYAAKPLTDATLIVCVRLRLVERIAR